MVKFANIVFFIGDLLKGIASVLGRSLPSYKAMQHANKVEKFIEELDKNLKP